MMKKHKTPHKSPRVNSTLDADVWFEPKVVIEVIGAEITLSPIHTCAMDAIRKRSGLAIRFPRFTGNFRLDKAAEDATNTRQIVGMYKGQLKKVAEQ
jgi:DNA ligase-1